MRRWIVPFEGPLSLLGLLDKGEILHFARNRKAGRSNRDGRDRRSHHRSRHRWSRSGWLSEVMSSRDDSILGLG